jgi:phosphoserine aminotransferase
MRKFNFSAGPCTLPLEVLEEAQAEFIDYASSGMSLIEMSHRGEHYDAVHMEALGLASSVFGAPDDFTPLFIGGGATLQFAMVAMNLLEGENQGAYVNSGAWAATALEDAGHHAKVYAAWDGSEEGFTRMPSDPELRISDNTRYLHFTSNETIGGIRYVDFPNVDVPLVSDMSSDYMSRSIAWERFDVVYGGVQKNLGPAGVDLTFVRKSVLENTRRDLATYLRYDIHAARDSMYNTPPVFSIYMMGKVLKWIQALGGVAAMEERAARRSAMVYDAIDTSDGFYRSPASVTYRSHMNIVFRLSDEEMESAFISEAEKRSMVGLRGHRDVGGIRASIYNAMPDEGVEALVELMREYRAAD